MHLADHEIRHLLEAVDSLSRILIFTVATTLLRQSELFGLRWSDIDFESGQINVFGPLFTATSATVKQSPRLNQYLWGGNSLKFSRVGLISASYLLRMIGYSPVLGRAASIHYDRA